jgi:hypothetical protein
MTPTLEHDLTTYLQLEADRAVVRDELDDIESGITLVPVVRNREQRRTALLLASAAASVALVGGIAVARDTTGSRPDVGAGSPPSDTQIQPMPTTATNPPAPTNPVTVPPTTQAIVQLPDGARFQGIAPSCTTADNIVYECTIPAYPEDVGTVDMRGYTNVLVDETSHVSGGCRSVSADATQLLCYVGERAVDEAVVGADYLGDWSPQGFTAG